RGGKVLSQPSDLLHDADGLEDGGSGFGALVAHSDAHFYTGIGDFSHAIALLKEIGFPEELVLNTDPARFLASLKKR
ncbi:MAG: hypothetical protein IJD29_08375, partial [Anaerotignum sp.]|nr:hypothetical protein [Anaerotignum sp.]